MKIDMKKLAFLVGSAVLAGTASAFNQTMYAYTVPAGAKGAAMGCIEAKEGMELEPGKWYTNFWVCKDYADKNGIPLVAIWSNHACIHCWYTDINFVQDDFIAWKETHDAGKVIYCFMAGGEGGYDQANSSAYNWMWYGGGTKLNAYPFVVLWWAKEGVNERYTGDNFCNTKNPTEASIPGRITTIEGRLENAFAKWSPTPKVTYAGGQLVDPDTEGNRLEFEDATKIVSVRLSRAETVATNVTLAVYGPTGMKLFSQDVAWAQDQKNASVAVPIPDGACATDGQKLTLYLQTDGKNMSTNHITYVKRVASAANPLWIGEEFGLGEWTCDLDGAKTLVAKTDGEAYTLVSIQGSMWCPDCANTDRNFLEVTDSAGNNRFQTWAKAKNIALVSMDIPNYNGTDVSNRATPTLFATNAYSTRLARPAEYPQSGADAALTNSVVRSGLGYLTRKGVTSADADAQLRKFHDCAYLDTDQGGYHRPEDVNKNRTGVPIFVLLRKDGSVAARFTRFASVSPMSADKANFDNYIKRFDEMLAIAAGSGDHADKTEIENNYPGVGAVEFAANGGKASGELCNADMQDSFRLVGVGGNADQKVRVEGTTSASVTVQFWKMNEARAYEAIGASKTGKLSDGVELTYSFTESGDYYLLVKGSDITSEEFAAACATENNFHAYTVSGNTVLVPQGDQVKANAPADSDKVVIRLVKDQVYCFSGVNAEDNPFLVDIGTMGAYTFQRPTESGDLEVKIATGLGGEISYQIWQPGQVAFVSSGTNVLESVNDLNDDFVEFQIARVDGKSGRVKARVTVDSGKSTLETARYVLVTNSPNGAVDFAWEDGDTASQTVRVHIEDDLFYEGDKTLCFNVEVLASDAGDVTVAEGRGTYVLTVLEDDKSEPGRGVITRTTPDYGKKGTVYFRESDGAKIWVERIEACDGLVAAELVSSVKGVTYETENPRDLEVQGEKTLLWWSSRESAEKYVQVKGLATGKTAKIQLKSFGDFMTVSGSNSVSIVAVADDAPAFAVESSSFDIYRYVTSSGVSVKLDAASLQGGKITFTKLSGTLPAGLSATYDDETKALSFTGTATAKPGTYEVTYQVVETRSGKRVAGLTTAVKFSVTDPTDVKTNPEGANPSVEATRTFKDIPVVNPVYKRMAGVLQLTVPTRGNVSGKYFCESGTISLSGKSWGDFNPETKGLSARLENTRAGVIVGITANANGSIDVVVADPSYPDVQLDATIAGVPWSQANTAEAWQGYYTVALPVEQVLTNVTENLAPTGTGYLTLDFTSKSAWKTGTVKWAGMLPNGTTVSGSSVFGSAYSGKSADGETTSVWAKLPVFKRSSTDVFSVSARVQRNAKTIVQSDRRAVLASEDVVGCWSHGERQTTAAGYLVNFGVYGAIYDKTEDLGGCCQEYYQTNEMLLGFDMTQLGSTYYGVPAKIDPLSVSVTENTIIIEKEQSNPANVKLSLNRSTGIVSGTLMLECSDTDVSAAYKGVVLTGWGEGCGCGPTAGLKVMPFVNGSFYFSDKIEYSASRMATVKRGGAAVVDSTVSE